MLMSNLATLTYSLPRTIGAVHLYAGPCKSPDLAWVRLSVPRICWSQRASGVSSSDRRASIAKSLRGHEPFIGNQHWLVFSLGPLCTNRIQASLKRALGSREMGTDDVPANSLCGKTFFLDAFAQRQWEEPDYSGTRMNHDKADFVRTVEKLYTDGAKLHPGYADFCKHLFLPNFVGAHAGHLRIDDTNKHLLTSAYRARSASELPVLSRWFPADKVTGQQTKMLDIILYSRDQLQLEQKATASKKNIVDKDLPQLPAAPWGIISIKAQDEDFELPMSPITIMRNALGAEEGGSGVPLDRDAYLASVEYWDQHAMIQ